MFCGPQGDANHVIDTFCDDLFRGAFLTVELVGDCEQDCGADVVRGGGAEDSGGFHFDSLDAECGKFLIGVERMTIEAVEACDFSDVMWDFEARGFVSGGADEVEIGGGREAQGEVCTCGACADDFL